MKGEETEQTLPRQAPMGTAKSSIGDVREDVLASQAYCGRVCGPGDRAPKPESFTSGDALVCSGSPRRSDEGLAGRGPRSSARTRKVCCTRIGRSRVERPRGHGDGVMEPYVFAVEAVARGGKA